MNIGKYEIVDIALENLQKNTGISGRWEEYGQKELDDADTKAVPPLLAYADFMNTNDRRCMETAQKIYNEFLQDKL